VGGVRGGGWRRSRTHSNPVPSSGIPIPQYDYEAVRDGTISGYQACTNQGGMYAQTSYQGVTVECGSCACCQLVPPAASVSEGVGRG